jgi:hypothetical protein
MLLFLFLPVLYASTLAHRCFKAAWGGLGFVVLIVMWDAITFGCLGISVALGRAWSLISPMSKEVWS